MEIQLLSTASIIILSTELRIINIKFREIHFVK